MAGANIDIHLRFLHSNAAIQSPHESAANAKELNTWARIGGAIVGCEITPGDSPGAKVAAHV
jgi:hypothetical protein